MFGSDRKIANFSAMQRLQFSAPPRRGSVRVTTSQSIVKFRLLRLHFHMRFESSVACGGWALVLLSHNTGVGNLCSHEEPHLRKF